MATRFQLKARQRLRRNVDFLATRDTGKSYRCPFFILFARIRPEDSADVFVSRIGISASRRVGNAVVRNRAKRLFKEIFRHNQELINPETDILLSLRPGAKNANYEELEQRFMHAMKFTRMLRKTEKASAS